MDKLIVKGLGNLDGTYEFDFAGMLGVGTPDGLTNREGHRIKVMSGVRAGELEDALVAGDNDVLLAFAAIILTRRGKTFDEARLWDAPMGSAISFDLAEREQSPPDSPAETPENEQQSTSGGNSSNSTSALQENGQSPTGHPVSETSAAFRHLTSAT